MDTKNHSCRKNNRRENKDESNVENYEYKGILKNSEGLYKDRGSRFIALAFPVETLSQIKSILEELKKKYYDARHCCYAYRLGYKADIWRANDDGEPAFSAGQPILRQIMSKELSDILVVVVRYFGGIKLGLPSLIKAYKTATSLALDNNEVIDKIAVRWYLLEFDYLKINEVMHLIKEMQLQPYEQDFSTNCSMKIKVPLSKNEILNEKVALMDECKLTEIEAMEKD